MASAFIARTVKHGAALHAAFPLNGKILIENLCGSACERSALVAHLTSSHLARMLVMHVRRRSERSYNLSQFVHNFGKQTFSQNCRCIWLYGVADNAARAQFSRCDISLRCVVHCHLG